MRISDWSSDVCSSDLRNRYARADAVARIAAQIVARIVGAEQRGQPAELALKLGASAVALAALQFLAGTDIPCIAVAVRILACDAQRHVCGERRVDDGLRSEEHTSELQSLMRISYAVFCLKKKNKQQA